MAKRSNLPESDDSVEGLLAYMQRQAKNFDIRLPTAAQLMDQLNHRHLKFPLAVLEPSDNPFSGGTGDTPECESYPPIPDILN